METIGPATDRPAKGALRRLLWAREVPQTPVRARLSVYGVPLVLLALIGLGFGAEVYLRNHRELSDLMRWLLAAGSVVPVMVTYRHPVLAWRLGFVMMFVGPQGAHPGEPWPWNPVQVIGFLLVLFRVASTRDGWLTSWATAFSVVGIFLYVPPDRTAGAGVFLVVIAVAGNVIYRRGRLLAASEQLTEQERAKRAVLEERARIAREMHDVVAHHMSMIAVRAETAPFRVAGLPASAQEELATIAAASREALSDMRRLLGALRAEHDDSPTKPQPGLADLEALVATARAAGVSVSLELAQVEAVPPTVGLAAYRIVQEALANAARHAPGRPVSIVARGDGSGTGDRLEVTVRNRLAGPVEMASGGHGLIGMRERVTLLGGTLTTGPDRSDFVVAASLPLDGHDPVEDHHPLDGPPDGRDAEPT